MRALTWLPHRSALRLLVAACLASACGGEKASPGPDGAGGGGGLWTGPGTGGRPGGGGGAGGSGGPGGGASGGGGSGGGGGAPVGGGGSGGGGVAGSSGGASGGGTGGAIGGACPPGGCPAGSYCDLAIGQCVAGCVSDEACPARHICEGRQCVVGCRACANDGNPCTAERCVDGECTHPPVPDQTACDDDGNECTRDTCVAGACTHPPRPDDQPCRDDGNECTLDRCSAGRCTAFEDPARPICDSSGYPSAVCVARSCSAPPRYCTVSPNGAGDWAYAPYSTSGGSLAESCGCDGSTLRWVWHDRVGGGSGSEMCSVCYAYSQPDSTYGMITVIGCWP